MSMTDEQIVRALECCVEGDTFCYGCGEDCPFIDVDMCTVILRRETLDLIKRKDEELRRMRNAAEYYKEKTKALKKELQEANSETARLKVEAEESYRQAEADINANIADGGTSCHWCIDKHRAEAVREFAERLKAVPIKCGLPLLGLSTKEEIEDYFNDIMMQVGNAVNNLVKEMTEKEGGKG